MKIKALEPITAYGPDKLMLFTGEEAVISDTFANQLIDEGKAEEVEDGGGGGNDNVVFIRTSVEKNIDTGDCTGGFYKDEETLYTYEELVALYESGATLLAYYDELPVSYIEVGDNGDDGYYFSAAVESTYDSCYYDVYLTEEGYELDAGALSPRPFIVGFSLNGSPSSLTGDDVYRCDHSFESIMAMMNSGGDVIGAIATPFSQDVLEYVGGSYNEIQQVMTFNFRYVKMAYGATDYMEVLELGVNNSNGGTHIHSEFHRYALTAYNP